MSYLVSLFSAKLFSSEGLRRKKLVYSGKKVRRTYSTFLPAYKRKSLGKSLCQCVMCISVCNILKSIGGFVSTIKKYDGHGYGDSSEGLRLDVHFCMDCHTRIYLLKYSWTGALGHSEGSIAKIP
jgi:hypothetical protein